MHVTVQGVTTPAGVMIWLIETATLDRPAGRHHSGVEGALSRVGVGWVHPVTEVLTRVGCLPEPAGERRVDPWCSMPSG